MTTGGKLMSKVPRTSRWGAYQGEEKNTDAVEQPFYFCYVVEDFQFKISFLGFHGWFLTKL